MKSVIPFTKDILFKSKIADIVSISLEHELNIDDTEVKGNFIVSGEYKAHAVSINKEKFEYKLPFNVELTKNIDLDTFSFKIVDFYYEVINDDVLRVDIEFEVYALEKKEEVNEELRENIVEFEEPKKEIIDTEIDLLPIQVEQNDSKMENNEERLEEEQKTTILNSISKEEDEYITYNVHIVREMDTIESISQTYNASIDLIKEYNNIDNLSIGDKIIIPQDLDE